MRLSQVPLDIFHEGNNNCCVLISQDTNELLFPLMDHLYYIGAKPQVMTKAESSDFPGVFQQLLPQKEN